MAKWIVAIVIVGAVIALAWINRIELLLTVVKFQSDREFVVEPERELPWQIGPAESTAGTAVPAGDTDHLRGTPPHRGDTGGCCTGHG